MKQEDLHVGELSLPGELEAQLLLLLETSNERMPAVVSSFQEWRVGLLPRFTAADT